jgi:putative endonuclease
MSAYLYIMSNQSHTLYVGSTVELLDRVRDHKEHRSRRSFTARYHFNRLVYFEILPDVERARTREMEIKGWTRAKKVALIQAENPNWLDLTARLSDLSFWGSACRCNERSFASLRIGDETPAKPSDPK